MIALAPRQPVRLDHWTPGTYAIAGMVPDQNRTDLTPLQRRGVVVACSNGGTETMASMFVEHETALADTALTLHARQLVTIETRQYLVQVDDKDPCWPIKFLPVLPVKPSAQFAMF